VQVLFVHHTATGNDYACSQSATIIRGIQAYHVRSKGWNDIGYNFLVDKCGNLFEGRKGGVDRPVLGAHTLGFNSHSSAVAVIGNYSGVGVSSTVRTVIAQVAAYKVGAYGHNASGSAVLVSNGSDRYPIGKAVTLHRISGHRDTGRTECPGNTLYAQLPAIRAIAGAGPARLGFVTMTGATKVGARYFTRGPVSPLWTLSTPSAMLDRFDVEVDGTLIASMPNSGRTRLLRLAAGVHTVSVRAVHLSGRTASITAQVVADPVAPVFSGAPSVSLRTGSLESAVPVRLGYAVADAGGLRTVTLVRPSVVDLSTTGRTWTGVTAPGVAATWTVRAGDWAGNVTDASVIRTPIVVSEDRSARTGSWHPVASPAYLGAAAAISSVAGSTMAWTFTGPSASLAVSRTPSSGRIAVSLDGADAGILDLRAPSSVNRIAIWAPTWGVDGRHTVKLVVEGTSGRPGVIVDGLVVLR
jgi:hypothetical protein